MKTIRKHRPGLVLLAGCLLGLFSAGCRITAPEHPNMNPAIHDRADASVSSEQLRLRMRSLVDPLCGVIEASADQIRNGTTNRAVQREALLWKIEAVPEMRKALFQPNPFTALADAWVLSCQMQEYFENGPGKIKLGDKHLLAADACKELESGFAQLTVSLTKSGDITNAQAFVQNWAAEHPIQTSISARESTLSRATEREIESSFSAAEAVGSITVTVDDLNRRLEIYSDQLFQQARWEAELFKSDLMTGLPVDQLLPLLERGVKSTERAATVAEDAPKMIAAEREKTLKELREAMATERATMTKDIGQTGYKMVDYAFWRATELTAIVLVFVTIGFIVVLVVLKRSRIKN